MPINATPEYQAAERKYKEAKTTQEKIAALEDMLRKAPSHKGAEALRADIKSKLARFREEAEKEKKAAGKKFHISVKKEGAAQVVLVGLTNSGKSYLLSQITNAKPEISPHEFTTKMPEVGVMEHMGVKIQIVEIPAITEDFLNKEKGPTFFSIIRNADLIVFVIKEENDMKILKEEFEKAGIITDRERPNVRIKKEGSGGISFIGKIKGNIEDAKRICRDYGILNAVVEIEGEITLKELEEVVNERNVFMKSIKVTSQERPDDLKWKIWKNLGLIKVYTKQPGKEKDWPPVAMKKGATIRDLAEHIHKDFIKKFRFARVWGSSKYPGQQLGLDYELHDEDVVEFHIK
ncbi:MAG: TGS domain-containing protein [Candidatus Nanoarchaeia archaeon]